MDISTILITSFLILLLWFVSKLQSNNLKNFPPGPTGVPLLGCFPFIKPRIYIALQNYGKKWGNLFSIKLGMRRVLILNSFDSIKEALVNQGHIFSGRLNQSASFARLFRNQGVIFTDGDTWKHQRRTAIRILKDFGFGRETSKEVILNEIEDLFQIVDSKNGAPILTQKLFNYCTANIINSLSVNERLAHVDAKFQKVLEHFDKIIEAPLTGFLQVFYPTLGKLPFFNQLTERLFLVTDSTEFCHTYIREKIAEHKKKFDPEQEPKDFIDTMLLLQKDAVTEPNYSPDLYDHRIIRMIVELFIAGMDTTATTLCWMMFLLAHHPDIQKKVQEEIDMNCDDISHIKSDDKKNLPYTCAVIDEVMRYSAIVPISFLHRTTENTKLMGFDIPKDTLVIPHLYGIHHNPEYWKHPEEFYPEHFLSADGKTYQPNDHLIAFSVGPRTCMGELLANMELFLIATSMIRKYNIKPSQTYSHDEMQNILIGKVGNIRRIKEHELIFLKRK